jgi:hypothetical protein
MSNEALIANIKSHAKQVFENLTTDELIEKASREMKVKSQIKAPWRPIRVSLLEEVLKTNSW